MAPYPRPLFDAPQAWRWYRDALRPDAIRAAQDERAVTPSPKATASGVDGGRPVLLDRNAQRLHLCPVIPSPSRFGAPPMDEAARYFIEGVKFDPWFVFQEPLPDDLDLAALQELRPVVYALLHALDFTLDEATELIGLLAEIDRRIALMERLRSSNR